MSEGKKCLSAAIVSNEFTVKYVTEKVNEWCEGPKTLSDFAKSQPQATYAAFRFCEQNKYSYFLRTIPSMSELMKPVDEIIQNDLLPTIIGESITENERQLFVTRKIRRSWHSRFFFFFFFFQKKPKMILITPYT